MLALIENDCKVFEKKVLKTFERADLRQQKQKRKRVVSVPSCATLTWNCFFVQNIFMLPDVVSKEQNVCITT
jgi:hypothetical protein